VQRGVVQHAGVERGGVHVVDGQPRPEQRRGLGQLLGEGGERVVLHLVDGHVELPSADVAVAPFRPDHHVVDLGVGGEPAGEELLGAPVGTRNVEVAHACGVRGVEHRRGAGP
jgi:hypothetical protein